MAKKGTKEKEWADDVKERATSRVAKLAADIAAKGGHLDGNGNLVMPLTGKQKLTGFDGNELKGTLSDAMKEVVDFMLDKREALENVKNTLDNAIKKVESEMKAEGLKVVTALDRHSRRFTITLKTGKTKLEVKAAK